MSPRLAVAAALLMLVCPLWAGAVTPAWAEPTELLVVRAAAPRPLPRLPSPAAHDSPAPAHGVWPLRPRPTVVAAFDPPASRWGRGHRGVDLAGRVGQEVRSALPGRVTFAGRLAGRGVVVVDHGGTRTTYEPVAASVAVGDRVAAGAVIGRLELFGSHCFPRACLHWGLIEGRETYLDPLTLVGAAPVVLLPYLTAVRRGA
jgi:murein DD-endopeptidase MepM/ murein hydrolase activator NlpD